MESSWCVESKYIFFEQVCESYGGPKIEKSPPHLFGGKSTSKILSGKRNIFVHMACKAFSIP